MDISVTTEKTPMESPVSLTPTGKALGYSANKFNEKYEKFTIFLTLEEWTFLRDDHHAYDEDYHFLVHDDCPKGLNIRPDGAVMHFETLKCQQCQQSPPDEMMAVYVLYGWVSNDKFGVWDYGTIE